MVETPGGTRGPGRNTLKSATKRCMYEMGTRTCILLVCQNTILWKMLCLPRISCVVDTFLSNAIHIFIGGWRVNIQHVCRNIRQTGAIKFASVSLICTIGRPRGKRAAGWNTPAIQWTKSKHYNFVARHFWSTRWYYWSQQTYQRYTLKNLLQTHLLRSLK